ncbi:MAG: hypothetical protein WCC67_09900, partial [Candidatus Acidiferrales bacterium]
MIAHDPLHGSGRADFPHPALTSGNDAHAAQGIRMIYACRRQPTVDQTSHSVPTDVAILAAARERLMPEQACPQSERAERGAVHGQSVIADVSTNDRTQPLTYFRDGVVHSPSEFVFYFAQLRLHPFTNRLPQHRVVSVASRLPADMREAEEGERFRLSFSSLFLVSSREPPELQKSRFVGVQFQAELPKPLSEFRKKLLGIHFALESNHDVIRVPHNDYIAERLLSTPCLNPQIENVMEIDVSHQWRSTPALRRTLLRSDSFPILQHARVQPLLDEPYDAPVRDAMLDELDEPVVRDRIEKAANVQIEHPVHF